jgi:hypothetical protein
LIILSGIPERLIHHPVLDVLAPLRKLQQKPVYSLKEILEKWAEPDGRYHF